MHGSFGINASPDAVRTLKIPIPFLSVALLRAVRIMAGDTVITAVSGFRVLRRSAVGVYLTQIIQNMAHFFILGIASQGVHRAIVIGDSDFGDYPERCGFWITGSAAAGQTGAEH